MSSPTLDDLLSHWEEQKEIGNPLTAEELCADQPELLDEVRWHIKALEAVELHFGLTQGKNGSTSEAENRPEIVPEDQVHVATDYQIERLHACGGLGRVYIATDVVLNRKVAIKFPRWEQLSTEQAARFEREARITGRLDHPGIIPIHALKSDSRDRPFYVMRFVDGQTLQARIQALYSESSATRSRGFYESVEFRQMLQNFVIVCNIVAYAHGEGVIHRDIKPSNVIVGPFEEVLLLDWGMAKVLADPDSDPVNNDSIASVSFTNEENAFETREGQILGTPAFASPEQLLGRTSDIESRSDVYSLGATLFVLLTGSSVTGATAFHEHLNRLKQGIQRSAHDEDRSVPRALEAICRCAMATELNNRYSSALMLANDVQRYLAGKSVSVNSDSVLVRFGRLIRSRPGLAAASLATVLVATIATATISLILGQKNQELHSNNERLKIAVTSSRTANIQTMDALRTLVDDIVTQKFSTQTELSDADRRFLQRIVQQYESFAAIAGNTIESKAIRAEGRYQSGLLLVQLGEEQQARAHIEAASELYQQLVDETDQVEYRQQLAATLVELGLSMKYHGELEAAERTANRGIALLAPLLSENTREDYVNVLEFHASLNQLKGEIQISSHRKDEALVSYSSAKDVFERLRDADPDASHTIARLASTYRALSDVCGQVGDIGQQEQYSRNALELYRKLMQRFPEDRHYCRGFAWACYDRSYSHEFFERTGDALDEMTEAEEVAGRLSAKYPLSDEFRGVLASMRIRRAAIHARAGHYLLAEADLRHAIVMLEEILGRSADGALSYRQLVKAIRLLGLLQDSYGRYIEAEATLQIALKHAAVFSTDYPESAAQSREAGSLPNDLAMVFGHQGQFSEAVEELQKRIGISAESPEEQLTPIRQLGLLQTHCDLSKIYFEGSQHAEARKQVDSAALIVKALEETHSSDFDLLEQLADFHLQITDCYRALDCKDQAIFHGSRQRQILEQCAASTSERSVFLVKLVRAMTERAELLADREDFTNAGRDFEAAEASVLRTIKSFPTDLSVLRAKEELLWAQGRFLFRQEDFVGALRIFDQAMSLNPESKHRAIRAWCLVLLRSDRAAPEISEIAHASVLAGPELVDFLSACGVAVAQSGSPQERQLYETTALQMLQTSVDDGCLLRPAVMVRLRSRSELAFLQNDSTARSLLDKLDPQQISP